MALLSEIAELLRRWDVWKRVESAPDRVDALEQRVAALEAKLQRCPGECCPKCGLLTFRTDRVVPADGHLAEFGANYRFMKCTDCQHEERWTD